MVENVAEPCQTFGPWSNFFYFKVTLEKNIFVTFRERVEGFETWNKKNKQTIKQKTNRYFEIVWL